MRKNFDLFFSVHFKTIFFAAVKQFFLVRKKFDQKQQKIDVCWIPDYNWSIIYEFWIIFRKILQGCHFEV